MTKLITVKEASALSASSKCIDSHIRHINKIIEVACTYGESNTVFDLWHCSHSNAVKIAAHLGAAGYCFRWHEVETNENRTRWYVSWGRTLNMGCIRNETCDFCEARCPHYMIDKRLWKELCEEFGKWCNYEEVEGLTYVEGRKYIENMPVWAPM